MYFVDEKFEFLNTSETPLEKGEYEDCTFINCQLDQADLQSFSFSDCQFEMCDLSMANLKNAAFQHVKFKNCKLLGLRFEECNKFILTLDFEGCMLNYSSFYQLNLKKINFANCQLQEVDFTETDLTQARFDQCDLHLATFERTILEKADFRTAVHFAIHPETNRLKKAKFSTKGLSGLLTQYNILISDEEVV